MITRTRASQLALLLPSLLLGGCSEDPRQAIVGDWRGETGVQDLRFLASGRAEIDDHKTGRRYAGRCRIDDGASMRCEFEGFARPVLRHVDIDGDRLTLTSPGGQPEHYRRRD